MSEPRSLEEAACSSVKHRPGAERRAALRHKFAHAKLARLSVAGVKPSLGGWAVDISALGVGLLLNQPVEPGTEVVIHLQSASKQTTCALPARVARAAARGDGQWIVGCALQTPLTAEQLEALLAKGKIGRLIDLYLPKSVVALKGYSWRQFGTDLVAGLVVGMVALPLAMAFAIGSGVPPERGLFTAIVAGFLISALGGSRVQIGGPTGAFVVIVYGIVAKYGYDGLVLATLMAGVILVLMGLSRLGGAVKFIPYPVTTGFTSGIAVVIFSSQINDLLGLGIDKVPPEFLAKWSAYYARLGNLNGHTAGLSLFCLAVLLL